MSGTFPSSPLIYKLKIRSFAPSLVSQGHDLTRQVRSRGVHRWFLFGKLPPNLRREQFAPIYAFAVAQRGQYETFTYVPPVVSSTRGTATTATVNGGSQTGRAVTINALSGTLKAMDFIKFANHDKVYMLIADVADTGTSLSIEPALVTSPTDASSVTVVDVPFKVSLLSDFAEIDVTAPVLSEEVDIEMVEVP